MSWFNFFPQSDNRLGANIPGNGNPLTQEINAVGTKIVKQNQRVNSELTKYKQMSALNKKLTDSYLQNLTVMVDISKLLNSYASFFDLLRTELEKNERVLGDLQLTDVTYIENLTKEKMTAFNQEFLTQTAKVKDIYRRNGRTDEMNRISTIESKLPDVNYEAGKFLTMARQQPRVVGGKKKSLRR